MNKPHVPAPSVVPPNSHSKVKHVIPIMSGKGGVGKSSVTALLAHALKRKGYSVGVLDADITGPSIPRMLGIKERAVYGESGLEASVSDAGIKIMSMNLLLPEEESPVIWRAPLITGAIRQFWTETTWGDLDYLLVDLPPGTGDAPLTVMQILPVTGVIIVMSPQELVAMIVKKAIRMAQEMDKKVLGIIENMSYVVCPKCQEKIELFGKSSGEAVSRDTGVPLLARLPIDPTLAGLADSGRVAEYNSAEYNALAEEVVHSLGE